MNSHFTRIAAYIFCVLASATIFTSTSKAMHTLDLSSNKGSCGVLDVRITNTFNADASACFGAVVLGNGENDVTSGGDPLLSYLNNPLITEPGWQEFTMANMGYTWEYDSKRDDNGTLSGGNNFFNISLSSGVGSNSGTWSLVNPIEQPFAISLKAAKEFAVYFFDDFTGQVNSGTWSTTALTNNGGNIPNISHISLFIKNPPPVMTSEPAIFSLMLIGLTGVVMAKRRRKQLV